MGIKGAYTEGDRLTNYLLIDYTAQNQTTANQIHPRPDLSGIFRSNTHQLKGSSSSATQEEIIYDNTGTVD